MYSIRSLGSCTLMLNNLIVVPEVISHVLRLAKNLLLFPLITHVTITLILVAAILASWIIWKPCQGVWKRCQFIKLVLMFLVSPTSSNTSLDRLVVCKGESMLGVTSSGVLV